MWFEVGSDRRARLRAISDALESHCLVPRAALLSGRALDGRYELHAVIGEGTFGRVYRGHDRRLARPVAVKVIKPWWTEDPHWASSFELEAQLMARVNHPGIVQIFDIGHADEGLYYVAELIEGESLADRLRRGALPPSEACEVAAQLCRALAHAHAQRVVHRDVKPGNVLISATGRVKVGDFGIARLAEGSTDGAAGTIVGTPRYMCPEQARGRPATPASDVYSAGVVLYEMLAGRPPFVEKAAVELALRHLSDPPPPLPAGTPSGVVEIVERALAKAPADRYPTAREMADALERVRASIPGHQPPPPAGTADALMFGDRVEKLVAARVSAPRRAPARTRVRPRLTPRRDVNPGESRRYRLLLGSVLAIMLGLAAWLVVSSGARVRVPDLAGLPRAAAASRLAAGHLNAGFTTSYSQAPRGSVIAQSPAPGQAVDGGAHVRVILSAGPAPVAVPQLTGQTSAAAEAILARLGLGATLAQVPAPGVTAGTVVQQSPGALAKLAPHASVALSVAETPRWRPLTSFAGTGSGRSVPFRIRGTRWRVVYRMSYQGLCTFIVFCSGPSAQVTAAGTGAGLAHFGLGEGSDQTRVFDSGPGVYQIQVAPGSDTASWSVEVQDDY